MAGRFTNLEFRGSGRGRESCAEEPAGALVPRAQDFHTVERSASYYMDQAVGYEMNGDFEEALRAYSAALGEDAQLLDAWVGQLWVLLEQREYPEVELWSKKALAYFPDNPSLLAVCSLALNRMHRKDDARAMNDNAMSKQGNVDIVWLCRGEIILQGKRAAVEECFHHAKRVAEHPEMTRLRIASVCLYNRKYQLALKELTELTGLCATSARAWGMLGAVQMKLGFSKQGRVSLEQAIDLAPGNAEYRDQWQAAQPGFWGRVCAVFRRNQ